MVAMVVLSVSLRNSCLQLLINMSILELKCLMQVLLVFSISISVIILKTLSFISVMYVQEMQFSKILAISTSVISAFPLLLKQYLLMTVILSIVPLHSLIILMSLAACAFISALSSIICQNLYAARVLNIFICCFDFPRYCQKSTAVYLLPLFIMIMSKIQDRFTPLLPILSSIIRKYDNRKELERAVFDQKLNLAIIEKSPVVCLSDFKHSVQACFSRKEDFACNPFNKMKSDYYTVAEKSWISLNADLKYVQEPKDFPTPYEPYFHFRANYKEYIEDRPNLKYRCECESVTVYSWSIRVVNIAQSGYYGIILHVLDSKRKGDRFVQILASISSILYEHELQTKMQSFRLADLRKNYKVAKDSKVPFSLFYYCKESELHSSNKRRPNNIIVLDTEKKFLTHNVNYPTKLVCFGQIQGIGCLKDPVKSAEINWEKIRALHSHNIDIFFNHLKSQSLKVKAKDKNEPMLWSSESQSQEEFHSHHSDEDECVEIDVEAESQQSNEDPLRNLYIKKFAEISLNQ